VTRAWSAAVSLVVLASVVGVGRPVGLLAWGPLGHRVIVRLALPELTPASRALLRDALGEEDLEEASLWADRVRADRPDTYNWHFVNVPYAAEAYRPERDCRAARGGDCIVAAVARARADLATRSLPRAARAEAARLLLHLVGDLHQPLHVIDNHDRGGNDVPVTVAGYQPPSGRRAPLNLHAVWDGVLVEARGLNAARYADVLSPRLAERPARDAASGAIDVVAWTLESHDLARRVAYAYPGFSPAGPPAATVALDADYQRAARAAVELQLVRAGVRLARVLNEAAARSASRP
jgi:nuclease S1